MEYLLNSREMKACDSGTIGYFGVPSLVLMERRRWQPLKKS